MNHPTIAAGCPSAAPATAEALVRRRLPGRQLLPVAAHGGVDPGTATRGRRAILGLAAAVILVLAAGMVYTGLRCTFVGDLDVVRISPVARRVIALIGALGHLARAVALAVIGSLIARAALVGDAAGRWARRGAASVG